MRNRSLCLLLSMLVAQALFAQAPDNKLQLTDVSNQTGIEFVHTDGGSGEHYIVESVVCGLALFDYNNDGWTDLYFLNGAPLKGTVTDQPPTNVLYRNNGDFTFSDVTSSAGVGDVGYGLGVVVADYNQDGYDDLYINNFGKNVLYTNNGNGSFRDSSAAMGQPVLDQFGAGCAFLDIEGDGDLDLYVANYVDFTYDRHIVRMIGEHQFHPGPTDYSPSSDILFRNNNDGTFFNISQAAGISAVATNSMGVLAVDVDEDGDCDIVVANDQMANSLFLNDGLGHFVERGVEAGIGFDRRGRANGNMGIEFGDVDADGLLDLFTTTYQDEMPVLYKNFGGGLFMDQTNLAQIDTRLTPHVHWGCGLVDFDHDSDLDLFVSCGHFMDNIAYIDDRTAVDVPNYLLENMGTGSFRNPTHPMGSGMDIVASSRGAAFDDLDNDGDIDVVVLNANGKPNILRNELIGNSQASSTPESPAARQGVNWLRLRLIGTTSNRSAVGAKVSIQSNGKLQIANTVAGRGYQSHYLSRLHFGLGGDATTLANVKWANGISEEFVIPNVNQEWNLIEGDGQAKSIDSPSAL
ncbi:CRTAC1 family protein [Aureliella helgolandensis]|uniref:ASPIC and UnbV n=1 Tax=Aureliella helgolandensis TaxID=2527968 RepID=A0A518G900_9BACT|nr:CRTAC1 family protein [Aureliella helgolandensis]QDV25067.1 ASPIC and UnbV [Aureliella helgolandensis]